MKNLFRAIKHWLMSESMDEHELLLKVIFMLIGSLMIFIVIMKIIGLFN